MLGALQFGLAALVSPLVSLGGEGTAAPLAVVMFGAAAVAVVALVITRRGERWQGSATPRGDRRMPSRRVEKLVKSPSRVKGQRDALDSLLIRSTAQHAYAATTPADARLICPTGSCY